ncbi:thiamine pyrophosphate-dependent dehydrogenase E1 component subunit alpha [Actinophytocola sp.]|uniref:thiamine pyrophosphate-dependent dehydrogenase E1 component subunit alpha n=1 Tax=Actinophytocola sp. TaxID=1872138 RepID=UPI002D80E20D|nr:thiamine pyrophosphate-dependent dehydrogenase E1 component subunit alpha [Actinophytocola sp.]HET9141706.1 thiamine pyrophosphate-dependent dehydrogenase E1 component subunit alpha [Actinophytocola sp.]
MTDVHTDTESPRVAAAADLSRYRMMLRIRAFEETALHLTRCGEIVGAVHPYTGHEAIATGVGELIGPADQVVSYYRCHGHALACGLEPTAMFAELLGRASGVNKGKGGSMHLADRSHGFLGGNSIVGANVGIAAGLAAAVRIRGLTAAVVVFLGDGAMGAGVVLETLRIAARQELPLLFVCENNSYQDRTPSHLVSELAPAAVATGLGVRSASVDGNDAGEVAEVAGAMLGAVRNGLGARFLEASTYLRDFHCQLGPVPPDPYRPDDEVRRWRTRDPVTRAERKLIAHGLPRSDLDALRRQAYLEMTDAAADALEAPVPRPEAAEHDLTIARW